jgi:hypothetical protein
MEVRDEERNFVGLNDCPSSKAELDWAAQQANKTGTVSGKSAAGMNLEISLLIKGSAGSHPDRSRWRADPVRQ